jgi:acetylornithine deacetylase
LANVIKTLETLVSFPSVVGTPNAAIVSWIKDYLTQHDAHITEIKGPEGDRSNLFASFGPLGQPGLILSGHMDVVPASAIEWKSDPYKLRQDGDRLYGRGTTDMKGFLAAALAIVPELDTNRLRRPVHLAFSYDEEAGCRGVPHMIKELPALCTSPFGAIIGEPSDLVPIRAHKGKAAARIIIKGKAGHSSRPDLGLNAIHALSHVMSHAVQHSELLSSGPQDPLFSPSYSTLQIGKCSGGVALNVIPAHAELELEIRAIPGVNPRDLVSKVLEILPSLEAQGFSVTVEHLSDYPGLSLDKTSPLAALLENASGHASIDAVSYGTEAGLFQAAGIPSIICGPGNIDRAHKPDEYICISELENAMAMLRNAIAPNYA